MPFEITPVAAGSGLPAEPPNTTSFGPTPAPAPGSIPGTPPTFLQWKSAGEPLGDPDVLVVDFLFPLIATRGVGEHENVITVRRYVAPPPPPPIGDYYTSLVYPFLVQDDLSIDGTVLERGTSVRVDYEDFSVEVASLESGTLVVTIAFLSYHPPLPEEMSVEVATLEDGTLVVTISFVTYDNNEDMSIEVAPLVSGTLEVTIEYVVYISPDPDTMSVDVSALTGGTLA